MIARERLKHELALALHMTVAHLSRTMTEREFLRWMVYRARYAMPSARIERGLAMIALKTAQAWGASDLGLEDFMFVDPDKAERKDAPTDVINALGGGQVHRLGQKKRKKG